MLYNNEEFIMATNANSMEAMHKALNEWLQDNLESIDSISKLNCEMWKKSLETAINTANAISSSQNPSDALALINNWTRYSIADYLNHCKDLYEMLSESQAKMAKKLSATGNKAPAAKTTKIAKTKAKTIPNTKTKNTLKNTQMGKINPGDGLSDSAKLKPAGVSPKQKKVKSTLESAPDTSQIKPEKPKVS